MRGNMYVHAEVRDFVQTLPFWTMVPGEFYDGFGQNTTIFALLAGVGNNDEGIEPLDAPRGLPDEVSWQIWETYPGRPIGGPGPTDKVASWFTLQELEEKVDWDRFRMVWHEFAFSVGTMEKLRKLAKEHAEVRIVFWFDATYADLGANEKREYTFTPRG